MSTLFSDDPESILKGKGQNVKNHFVESQKKNIESLKFEKDQNVESLICLIFKFQLPVPMAFWRQS
jgi:hypothetical protein